MRSANSRSQPVPEPPALSVYAGFLVKHDYGLAPLRIRGLACVELHTDLAILARLSATLARARAIPLTA